MFKKEGRLKHSGSQIITEIDPTDIVIDLGTEGDHDLNEVRASCGYIGLRVRGSAPKNILIGKLFVEKVQNDAVCLWNGGVSIEHLIVDHSLDIEYSDSNHPDVFQAYSKSATYPFGFASTFDGLYLGKADVNVECHGSHDFKNGFLFSEVCAYRNISLFSLGIDFLTNSAAPCFLDMTNAQELVVGSVDHPVDPRRVSNKSIRIEDRKGGAPDCENIVIHAYEGLGIILGESAEEATQIIWYKHKSDKAKSMNEFKDRGLRNNNPGNLRNDAGDDWLGLADRVDMTEVQKEEESFYVFSDAVYGVRAMCVLLQNYQSRNKLKSIKQIINKWAPYSENNTAVYVAVVCAKLKVKPNDVVSMRDFNTLKNTVIAIIEHENKRGNPYSDELIEKGMAMSGVSLPGEPQRIDVDRRSKEKTTGGLVAGGSGAVAVVEYLKPAAVKNPATEAVIVETLREGKVEKMEVLKPVVESTDSTANWYEILSAYEIGQLILLGIIALAAIDWMLDRRLTRRLGLR